MKKIRLIIPLLLIVGGGVYYWQAGGNGLGEDGVTLYGNVDIREVSLAFRQPGRLKTMAVEEGDAVKAGDMLASLDDQPYRDALAAAAAQVALATAQLAKLEHGNRPQEIVRADDALRAARAQVRKTEAEFKRQKRLVATGAVSEKVLEAARLAHDQATAAESSAKQTLSLMHEGARSEDIAVAQAQLDAAEAAHSRAELALGDTMLTAPASGTINSRVREPGSMVTSRDAVYTLLLTTPLYVRAWVDEMQLGRVKPRAMALISADGIAKEYHGHIGFIASRAEFTPRTVESESLRSDLVYRLRIIVDDADASLRQGMPVTIRLGGA